MKKMLIVLVAVAVAAIGYFGTGPVPAVWGTADYQSDAQSLTPVGGTANVDSGSLPTGVFYLCADDAEEEEAPAEEKEEEPVPGVDRTWNVVMYG
jgi:hypothetical protein